MEYNCSGLTISGLKNSTCPRITGGKEWDLTYNGKGGSHVAAVGTNYVVYTTTIDNSDRMIKYEPNILFEIRWIKNIDGLSNLIGILS